MLHHSQTETNQTGSSKEKKADELLESLMGQCHETLTQPVAKLINVGP